MKVEKVDQSFTATLTTGEADARALQRDLARARGVLRDKGKEKPEDHEALSRFLDLLTHQIPPPWKPKEA